MPEYERRVIKEIICIVGETSCSDGITVEIVDEGGGEFVLVGDNGKLTPSVSIDPKEWPLLRDAINNAIGRCRG